MSDTLSASVGTGGVNAPTDVELVQRRLLAHGLVIGLPDGRCGPRTRTGIITFQSGFLRGPDGRVDPGGTTWRRLQADPAQAPPPPVGGSLTRLVPAPVRSAINGGLTPVNNAYMTRLLGEPREDYSADCQPVTNRRLRRNISTASVGPFRVTGLSQAVASLQAVMADVAIAHSDVHAALGTAGMLCCRWVRGSTTSISNHSWGTAVDLKINGVLDRRGDGQVQYGLTMIAPIFNQHGWYWGATFPTEDAMHFEASRTLVQQWAEQLSA
jgi:hypothetical protein